MRRVVSFGLKIVQFLVSKKVCVINVCTMRKFAENHLIKCNQPSTSQLTFTCSKFKNGNTRTWCENMFKVNSKDTRTKLMTSFCCLYCLLWTCNCKLGYLHFILMDRWTQKRIQNPVKHLRWSILQKYLEAFSC